MNFSSVWATVKTDFLVGLAALLLSVSVEGNMMILCPFYKNMHELSSLIIAVLVKLPWSV